MKKTSKKVKRLSVLQKVQTGISGFDEITFGGLPQGRPTLVIGGAGAGKTLFAAEFLFKGATMFNEPGVFMAFEETAEDLAKNVKSLGFNLKKLVQQKKIYMDYVRVERSEIEETGEYDLSGLFLRIDYAIKNIGAKRVVLDTIESLFSGLNNTAILRAELRRLFMWLKEKGVTVIITGERGDNTLTKQGLEEYVSDCVILLDHRITEQVSTRRIRIVKYRGSSHGTNEYPFLINEDGITIIPVTSLKLDHKVSKERITSGIPRLDKMLDGKGFFKGSSVLITGTAGTGKTSIAASVAVAAVSRNERVLYFAFEESPDQIIRNMQSIGINFEPYIRKSLLQIHSSRPTIYGLEMHLASMYTQIRDFKPDVVIIDPITNLIASGTLYEVKSMVTRMTDYLKVNQITAIFTALTKGKEPLESTDIGISSQIDTWILLKDKEKNSQRIKQIYLLKSRGMAHSNQVREYLITDKGIDILETGFHKDGKNKNIRQIRKSDGDIKIV